MFCSKQQYLHTHTCPYLMSPCGNIWTASATTSSSRLFTWTMTDYKADRQKDRHTDRQTDRQKTNTQMES